MKHDTPELLPVRMLNEFVYCPRLFYLEWVQGEWADNAFTVDGKAVHRRVDEKAGKVAAPEEEKPFRARSVSLSAPLIGLSTRVDLLEGDGEEATPVEYKRGKPAPVPLRVWDPERVQVAAQALALRENGHVVSRGQVYFAQTRERVDVPIDAALEAMTREAIAGAREVAASGELPAPLADSPKCGGCSLNGICLPDETVFLEGKQEGDTPRRFVPARQDGVPLYVQAHGARLGVSDERLVVKDRTRAKLAEVRMNDTTQVCLLGNVQITAPAIRRLCERGMPVSFFGYGGWFYGRLTGADHKNVEVRRAQYRHADDPIFCLKLARRIVSAKIANGRTLVRRNHPGRPRRVLDGMNAAKKSAEAAEDIASLLGVEGSAARLYFEALPGLLKTPDASLGALDFEGRNRRPPRDPVNAMLSFCYALLTKDWTLACAGVGLDPYLGFYHQPRHGRPALALDLMEEFRPLVADSTVLHLVNNGAVTAGDFVMSSLGVSLKPGAKKRLIETYERRMDELVTHPVFDYRISYRRVFEVQARLLSRHLLGELRDFPAFLTR